MCLNYAYLNLRVHAKSNSVSSVFMWSRQI